MIRMMLFGLYGVVRGQHPTGLFVVLDRFFEDLCGCFFVFES